MKCKRCGSEVSCFEGERGKKVGICAVCGKGINCNDRPSDWAPSAPVSNPEVIRTSAKPSQYYSAVYFKCGKASQVRGPFDTVEEARRVCIKMANRGDRCVVETNFKSVLEWIDGHQPNVPSRELVDVEYGIGDKTYHIRSLNLSDEPVEKVLIKGSHPVSISVFDEEGRLVSFFDKIEVI